jgi:hypothetical protein
MLATISLSENGADPIVIAGDDALLLFFDEPHAPAAIASTTSAPATQL